jgi:hypothetical protein
MLLTVILVLGRILEMALPLMEIVQRRISIVEKPVVLHGLLSLVY